MSTDRTGSVPMPSVQSVVAGLHDDGEIVTVIGVANGREVKTSNRRRQWASFELIGERTSVEMIVLPDVYTTSADLLGPQSDGTLLPPIVTVTGKVDARLARPVLYALHVIRAEVSR